MEQRKKVRKRRTMFTKVQLEKMEKRFSKDRHINFQEIQHLSQEIGLTEKNVQIWFKNRRSAEKRRSKSAPLPYIQPDYSPNINPLNLSDDYRMAIHSSLHEMDAPESSFIDPYVMNMANNQNLICTSENQYANANIPSQFGADLNFDLLGNQPSYAYRIVDYPQMRAQPAYNSQLQFPNVSQLPNSWQHPQGSIAQNQYCQTYFQQPEDYGYYQAQRYRAPMHYQQNVDHNQIPSYQYFPSSGSFVSMLESDENGGPYM